MSFTICVAKRPTLFAIVDGNNFFASCERVFNPSINTKPIVVLSSNDGCAIARSNETKALGIAMGAPLHSFSHLIQPHDIHIFSSNFELYGDLSNRMMTILQTFTPDVEIYSIDEAFLDLSRLPLTDLDTLAQSMYDTVLKFIGIPITIGIASTKTLAKVANRVAKKQRKTHIILQSSQEIKTALSETSISDVWGVGRAITPKLKRMGIYTALDLSHQDPRWARKFMTVTGERLVRELQGMACIPFTTEESDRQSIQVTRTFGIRLTSFDDIAEAISAHATRLGEKLRKKNLVTPLISVYCRTSPFSSKPYFKGIGIAVFEAPTNDTQTLIRGAMQAFRKAYRQGHEYQSAGIHAMELTPEGFSLQKQVMIDQSNVHVIKSNQTECTQSLIKSIDVINKRHGSNTVFWASSGIKPRHTVKRNKISSRYTTRWDELVGVF
jgi:DNA polymerase V